MFDIGTRLISLRQSYHLSANKLSISLGVNPSTINKIEKGTALPSMQLLFNICDYFKISPSDFFADDHPQPNISPTVNELINIVKELPPEKVKPLIEIAKQLKG